MTFNFVQFAGAVPFSSFLGGKKRSLKRKGTKRNKRTNKRTKITKRTEKRRNDKQKETKKRTETRRNKRTKKRTEKRRNNKQKETKRRTVMRRNKQKKTSRIKVLKNKCKCGENLTNDSPDGLGNCAKCSPEGIVLKGKDGNLWINAGDHWEMIRKDIIGGKWKINL